MQALDTCLGNRRESRAEITPPRLGPSPPPSLTPPSASLTLAWTDLPIASVFPYATVLPARAAFLPAVLQFSLRGPGLARGYDGFVLCRVVQRRPGTRPALAAVPERSTSDECVDLPG